MKYIWMPMVDSYHHRRVVVDDWSGYGLSFLDERRYVGHPQADPHARRDAHGTSVAAPTPKTTPDKDGACLC